MKHERWITFCEVLLLVLSLNTIVHADLIYQPAPGTNEDQLWREAGSHLLAGVARIFDGLSAVELGKKDLADEHLKGALSRLKRSSGSYVELTGAIKSPRKFPIAYLPADQRDRIKGTFDAYKVPVPGDERELATLATNEIERIVSFLNGNRIKVIGADLRAVQALLSEITRLQRIGTHSAELMSKILK